MNNIPRLGLSVLCLAILSAGQATAQDDRFVLGGSVQQEWDSNFNRVSDKTDDEEVSEQVTVASAFVSANKTISRQRLSARWQFNHYDHQEYGERDATINVGRASWQGEWGSRLSTEVSWLRDAYLVDPLEFDEKDVVRRDDVTVSASYGAGHRLVVGAGVRQGEQTHSHGAQESLNYDDDEAFVELGYKTGVDTLITARYRVGERVYPNPVLDPERFDEEGLPLDRDFDYTQAEIEGVWHASPKTNLSTTLGYFTRDGGVNDGSGYVVAIDANWAITPKVDLSGGYSFKQPAVGETSDSPTEVQSVSVGASWQWTSKISLSTRAAYAELQYDGSSPGPERDEKYYSVTPLSITYRASDSISLRLNTAWVDRQSPVTYRDYESKQATLGIYFRY